MEILPYGGRIVVFRPFIGRFDLCTGLSVEVVAFSVNWLSIALEANLAPDQGYPVRFTGCPMFPLRGKGRPPK